MGIPALQAYLEKEYGGAFDVRESTPSISVNASKIIDHNYERMAVTFVNLGADDVWLAPSINASITHGVYLAANGGFLSLNVRNDLVLVGREWYAVTQTGTSTLYIAEILRYRNPQ